MGIHSTCGQESGAMTFMSDFISGETQNKGWGHPNEYPSDVTRAEMFTDKVIFYSFFIVGPVINLIPCAQSPVVMATGDLHAPRIKYEFSLSLNVFC